MNMQSNAAKKFSRRKYIIAAMLFLCVLAGYISWVVTWRSETSQYQNDSDRLIRKIVARGFQKEPDQLNNEDFSQVTRLIIGENEYSSAPMITELADIKLLEKFTNLEILSLGRIIYPKKGIPKWMKTLSKYGIVDIDKKFALDLGPLAKLKNLQTLTIRDTHVKNIKALSNLVNLKKLDLSQTNIKDIRPISKMVNLERLVLNSTAVSDLKPIRKLKNLEYLSIMQTNVTNLEPISELTNLQTLYTYQSKISDIEPLKELTNLQSLYMGSFDSSGLGPLRNSVNLRYLELGEFNEIIDLEPLSNLQNLSRLTLYNINILSLEPLKKLEHMGILSICNCPEITDEQVEDLQKALPNLVIER